MNNLLFHAAFWVILNICNYLTKGYEIFLFLSKNFTRQILKKMLDLTEKKPTNYCWQLCLQLAFAKIYCHMFFSIKSYFNDYFTKYEPDFSNILNFYTKIGLKHLIIWLFEDISVVSFRLRQKQICLLSTWTHFEFRTNSEHGLDNRLLTRDLIQLTCWTVKLWILWMTEFQPFVEQTAFFPRP